MDKKAQVLIIGLWVLVVLTIIALSIGRTASLGLKSAKAQRDVLRAICMAKTALSRATVEIRNGTWQENADKLKKIKLEEDGVDYADVKISDEQSKIDINIASQDLLAALFEYVDVPNAEGLAKNTLIWRGDTPDTDRAYDNIGYPLKANKISNIEELILVKGMSEEYINSIRDFITVHGDEEKKINLNTVSEEVLKISARVTARPMSISLNYADSITAKLIGLRNMDGAFENRDEVIGRINFVTLTEEEKNLLSRMLDSLKYTSDNFLIEVAGFSGKITTRLSAVYNMSGKKILYWHES